MAWLYRHFYMLVVVFSADVFAAGDEISNVAQSAPTITTSTYFVDQIHYAHSPRVVASSGDRQYITQQELIYFDGKQSRHRDWGVYRSEVEFQHGNQSTLVLRLLATGELVESSENISILHISKQYQEVKKGDYLLPLRIATASDRERFPRSLVVRDRGE
ncbi:MAG: hypothetical protein ACK5MF_13780 [Vibrio sp.]|uniref:hypothetical protein n=1 Tax=Vibrio sp. TaxID=678 RepID=UPI003A85D2A2